MSDLAVPGSDIEKQGYITFEENQVKKIDADAYVKKITRMKPTPAFDALSLESPENEEFGDDEVMARHFTEFAEKHSKVKWNKSRRSDDKAFESNKIHRRM